MIKLIKFETWRMRRKYKIRINRLMRVSIFKIVKFSHEKMKIKTKKRFQQIMKIEYKNNAIIGSKRKKSYHLKRYKIYSKRQT